MDTGMTFQAWSLYARPLVLTVAQTPVGALELRSWRGGVHDQAPWTWRVPEGGSAMLLPVARTVVVWPGAEVVLDLGCFALVPGGAYVFGGTGLAIYTPAYVGLAQAGGPVEASGRLKYIDGCSDSLLVCPARIGEPCLNLLHLPPHTAQTAHTHPSERIGIILRGAGTCRTPEGEHALGPGMFWWIPPGAVHAFHTGEDSLDVLAWHPDSDFGPTHDAHPMLNRTIVDGITAADPRHAGIRTTALDGRA
jgi:mannose-6-phosphate isomerase-like protein (cupin superfamily)